MNSIVVHYKELALKGRNRPWFVQMLVRNLKVALAGLDIAAVRSVMGRIEIELAIGRRLVRGAGPPAACVRDRELFVRRARPARFRRAGRGHSARSRRSPSPIVPRAATRRADKRFPFTSPQIEREVGGLIKDQTNWQVDLERS